jgi:hypothetical protein
MQATIARWSGERGRLAEAIRQQQGRTASATVAVRDRTVSVAAPA